MSLNRADYDYYIDEYYVLVWRYAPGETEGEVRSPETDWYGPSIVDRAGHASDPTSHQVDYYGLPNWVFEHPEG